MTLKQTHQEMNKVTKHTVTLEIAQGLRKEGGEEGGGRGEEGGRRKGGGGEE